MKRIVTVAIVLALTPAYASAQERVGDAAIGALSGAVVLGPVGLVAGAIIGYSAGPSIARHWRASTDYSRPRARAAKRPARVASKQRTPASPAAGSVTPQAPAPGTGGPPAQGLE